MPTTTLDAPVVTSATTDKASYAKGDSAVLTVSRTATGTVTTDDAIAVSATGADGQVSAPFDVNIQITETQSQTSTTAVSDSAGVAWALQSDDGATAVYTATI
jgi:hypothetical protein